MTPTPHEPSDEELAGALGAQLHRVGDALHARPPADGRARIDARVRHHRRTNRVQTGLTTLVAVVVLIAGVAVLGGQGGEQGAPVMAGPGPDAAASCSCRGKERSPDTAGFTPETTVPPLEATDPWSALPLLAPVDADWHVEYWSPRGRTLWWTWGESIEEVSPSRSIKFEQAGWNWSLSAQGWTHEFGESPRKLEVEGRDLAVLGWSGGPYPGEEGLTPDMPTLFSIFWNESPSVTMSLHAWDTSLGWDTIVDAPGPSDEVIREVVSGLQVLPRSEWIEALTPPEGVPDPFTQQTNRPIHLGPPSLDGEENFLAYPWRFTRLSVPAGIDRSFVLTVSSRTPPPPEVSGNTAEVALRGTTGTLTRAPLPGDLTVHVTMEGEDADIRSMAGLIEWSEGNSHVDLIYPEGTSETEAIAFADSLVILDDAQWERLLFPDVDADPLWQEHPETTPTTGDPDEGAVSLCQEPDAPTWIVFLDPEATADQIAAVGDFLYDAFGERRKYFDQAAAYEEFRETFADSPEMIDAVTPDILPPSWRVWVTPESGLMDGHSVILDHIAKMGGVREVISC